MKLNQEGVEKAKDALNSAYADDGGTDIYAVRAALTAYFDHLREAGLMQEGRGWDHAASGYWGANSSDSKMLPHDFLCLIIKQPEEGK